MWSSPGQWVLQHENKKENKGWEGGKWVNGYEPHKPDKLKNF